LKHSMALKPTLLEVGDIGANSLIAAAKALAMI
jgi:hypothetical protein